MIEKNEESNKSVEKTEEKSLSAWLDNYVTGHDGGSLSDDMDFFHPPPDEIGDVQTAFSTLRKTQKPRSLRMQMIFVMMSAVGGVVLGFVLNFLVSVENPFLFFLFPVMGLSVGGFAGWGLSGFSHRVTYVGERGIAQISCTGAREKFHTDHMLLFQEAENLRTRVYAHYTNNVYARTDYRFVWTDAQSRVVLRIAGAHHSEENEPPPESSYHYACSAENSWTVFVMENAKTHLRAADCIRFLLRSGGFVGVGTDHMMISIGGKTERIESSDIKSIDIYGGTFQVRTAEAHESLFRRKGIYEFDYADLANVKLFLITLERLLGFGFG